MEIRQELEQNRVKRIQRLRKTEGPNGGPHPVSYRECEKLPKRKETPATERRTAPTKTRLSYETATMHKEIFKT